MKLVESDLWDFFHSFQTLGGQTEPLSNPTKSSLLKENSKPKYVESKTTAVIGKRSQVPRKHAETSLQINFISVSELQPFLAFSYKLPKVSRTFTFHRASWHDVAGVVLRSLKQPCKCHSAIQFEVQQHLKHSGFVDCVWLFFFTDFQNYLLNFFILAVNTKASVVDNKWHNWHSILAQVFLTAAFIGGHLSQCFPTRWANPAAPTPSKTLAG